MICELIEEIRIIVFTSVLFWVNGHAKFCMNANHMMQKYSITPDPKNGGLLKTNMRIN